jgi:hypothetical protein
MNASGFLTIPIDRLLIICVLNSLIIITVIKITKCGALETDCNAFPKMSNNFETLFKREKNNKETIDGNILLQLGQWKDRHQVMSLFPKENFLKEQSNQQLVYMSNSLYTEIKKIRKEIETKLTCKGVIIR